LTFAGDVAEAHWILLCSCDAMFLLLLLALTAMLCGEEERKREDIRVIKLTQWIRFNSNSIQPTRFQVST